MHLRVWGFYEIRGIFPVTSRRVTTTEILLLSSFKTGFPGNIPLSMQSVSANITLSTVLIPAIVGRVSYELRNRSRSRWSLCGLLVRASECGIRRSKNIKVERYMCISPPWCLRKKGSSFSATAAEEPTVNETVSNCQRKMKPIKTLSKLATLTTTTITPKDENRLWMGRNVLQFLTVSFEAWRRRVCLSQDFFHSWAPPPPLRQRL